jgi:hypothetical protein
MTNLVTSSSAFNKHPELGPAVIGMLASGKFVPDPNSPEESGWSVQDKIQVHQANSMEKIQPKDFGTNINPASLQSSLQAIKNPRLKPAERQLAAQALLEKMNAAATTEDIFNGFTGELRQSFENVYSDLSRIVRNGSIPPENTPSTSPPSNWFKKADSSNQPSQNSSASQPPSSGGGSSLTPEQQRRHDDLVSRGGRPLDRPLG